MKLEVEGESEELDFFDEDDMGEEAKRFQIGYQIGVNAMFNKFSVGVAYDGFFTEFAEDMKMNGWSIGVGINF